MDKVKLPISVIIHTKDADQTLDRCIKSVLWSNDIVVIDMHSTDKTVAIAKKYTNSIFLVEDVGFADPARNFGLSKAKNHWILVLDADEETPASFTSLLPKLMKQEEKAWFIPRKNILFNKWIKHTNWWPDYQLRFFPKGTVTWSEKVHTLPESSIETGYVEAEEENAIIHHNYASVNDFIDRLNRYTSLELSSKKRHNPAEAFSASFDEFMRRYFMQNGFKDKTHGLYLSLLQSFYEAIVSIKDWEAKGFPEISGGGINFDYISKTFAYWRADYKAKHSSGIGQLYWRIRRKFKI
jgi:glycosyltransferase involved in cell wall biosynthesis